MSRSSSLCAMCLGCSVLMAVGVGEAQQRALPTGTPTFFPRKTAQEPTPVPMTPSEVQAQNLGVELSLIDGATWEIVRSSWTDEDSCLEAVDAHLAQTLGDLKRLVRTSSVMKCADDADSKRKRLRLSTEEARRAFLVGYGDVAAAVRILREELADEPAAIRVLDAAREKQADWQDLACSELESEKVQRGKGQPAKALVRSGSQRGNS